MGSDEIAAVTKLSSHLLRTILRMVPLIPAPEIYDLVKDLSKSRTDLDNKISRAQASLAETSELIAELESGLNDRVAKLQQLKEEYDKYSRLAEVEEEKAGAIIQQIETALGRNRGRERIVALALNLLAGVIVFILGIVVGPTLTRWLGISTQ